MSYSKLQNITCTIKASGGDSRKMPLFAKFIIYITFLPAGDNGQVITNAEAGVPLSARMVGTDFRRCKAVSEGWHEHRAGKDVSPRQVADALTFIREIRVFPPRVQAITKNHQRPNADARVRRVCGICGEERMRNGANHTVSPLGAKRPTLPALGRFGRLGAQRKGFQVWRGRSGQY